MPKYLIERNVPGLGQSSSQDLQVLSQKSNEVLRGLGPDIHWVESYVLDDKLYCVYYAPNQELIGEHAKRGGFPCDVVSEVHTMIDPTTAEGPAAS